VLVLLALLPGVLHHVLPRKCAILDTSVAVGLYVVWEAAAVCSMHGHLAVLHAAYASLVTNQTLADDRAVSEAVLEYWPVGTATF
jgi:hypothetical protein